MSNLGVSKASEQLGLKMKQTQLGDQDVVKEMLSSGAVLGGDDSGHIIFLDEGRTPGGGMFIALKLLEVISGQSQTIPTLGEIFQPYPQVMITIPVQAMADLHEIPEIQQVINEAEEELGDHGRVLLCYCGSQIMVRIMVEGMDSQITERIAGRIKAVIQQRLGASL